MLNTRLIKKLQNEHKYFSDMLKSIEKIKKKTPGNGFAKMKGKLNYPASGQIVNKFGTHRNKKLSTIDQKNIEEEEEEIEDQQVVNSDSELENKKTKII